MCLLSPSERAALRYCNLVGCKESGTRQQFCRRISHRPYGTVPLCWDANPGLHPGLFSYPPYGRNGAARRACRRGVRSGIANQRVSESTTGGLRFLVSHPFRKEREMDGARGFYGWRRDVKQPQVLRLPFVMLRVAQDDKLYISQVPKCEGPGAPAT